MHNVSASCMGVFLLQWAKLLKDNMMKEERKALEELRELKDKVIISADKGNATVMMDREIGKKMDMLGTATYNNKLKEDPMATQESKISQELKEPEEQSWD